SSLATDKSGSHYFAARDTEADYVKVYSMSATNPAPEHEKFLFYRGVGSFKTPLLLTVDANESVTVANTGTEPLSHLFLLGQKDGSGKFVDLGSLEPGADRTVAMESTVAAPTEKVADQLGEQMALALVKAGLYPSEARAMIKTWRDSWFEEDGLRVLYVLPRV